MNKIIIITLLLSSCSSIDRSHYSKWDNYITDKQATELLTAEIACERPIKKKKISEVSEELPFKSIKDPSRMMRHIQKSFYRVECGSHRYACKFWSNSTGKVGSIGGKHAALEQSCSELPKNRDLGSK